MRRFRRGNRPCEHSVGAIRSIVRVTSLRQLVDSPALTPLLAYLTRPHSDPLVERVALIEDLDALARVEANAVVLLARIASEAASSYRFDVALRVARSRDVAALVLSGGAVSAITPTSAAIADRSGTAILATGADVDLAELAVAIARELAGGAELALRRAHSAMRAIDGYPADGKAATLVQRAGAALGVPLRLVDAEPSSGPRAPVVVDDHIEAWVAAPPQDGVLALGLDLTLHAAADGVARALTRVRRSEELPIRSRDEVLSELLSAPEHAHDALVQRARTLGVPIDGWHVAVRVEFEELTDVPVDAELAGYQARLELARALLRAVGSTGGTWHTARAGQALILVRSERDDPGIGAASSVAKVMDAALARVRSRLPATLIRCGVGSAHSGPGGLRASATEAKVAVAVARTSGRVNASVPFDSVGLRRTLVDWYASDTAQEAVTTVLAPLFGGGRARAERLIQTLHVYLDQQGSLARTAEVLNLHRNAVRYRVDQIFDLLDVDRRNPDDLLLLQLACRARELGAAAPA
jgi:sugar diacid utilization regulator